MNPSPPRPGVPPSPQAVLERALHFGFDETGWHPALEAACAGLSPEHAAWTPGPGRNSVHALVRHLCHWKRAALDDFAPLAGRAAFAAYSAEDWTPPPEDADWVADLEELRRLSRALLERVAAEPEAMLEPPPGGRQARLWSLLNLASHDAYHAGQIGLLRRLQGV